MNEKRFLLSILAEGILLVVLSLIIFIVPKFTDISFGIILCIIFFIYGVFKIINSIKMKKVLPFFMYNIFLGVLLILFSVISIILPMLVFPFGIIFIGIYLLLESFSVFAFSMYLRTVLNLWWISLIPTFWYFLLGLIIILFITNISFYLICMFIGLAFVMHGTALTRVYIANKYMQNKL